MSRVLSCLPSSITSEAYPRCSRVTTLLFGRIGRELEHKGLRFPVRLPSLQEGRRVTETSRVSSVGASASFLSVSVRFSLPVLRGVAPRGGQGTCPAGFG